MTTQENPNGTTVSYAGEGERVSLAEAQDLVGGYVTVMRMRDGRQMLVDEDGLLKRLPHNEVASALMGFGIVGNVMILKEDSRWLA